MNQKKCNNCGERINPIGKSSWIHANGSIMCNLSAEPASVSEEEFCRGYKEDIKKFDEILEITERIKKLITPASPKPSEAGACTIATAVLPLTGDEKCHEEKRFVVTASNAPSSFCAPGVTGFVSPADTKSQSPTQSSESPEELAKQLCQMYCDGDWRTLADFILSRESELRNAVKLGVESLQAAILNTAEAESQLAAARTANEALRSKLNDSRLSVDVLKSQLAEARKEREEVVALLSADLPGYPPSGNLRTLQKYVRQELTNLSDWKKRVRKAVHGS